MSVMETKQIPGPWSVDDLPNLPEGDGHRYEIIDGVLFVSRSSRPAHQAVVLQIAVKLLAHAPEHLKVYVAPLDVVLAHDTVVEPDVLVAHRDDFTELNLPAVPLLAVEVLSPGTRRVDVKIKKDRYERAGISSYWLIDPEDLTMTVFELDAEGCYAEIAVVPADDMWSTTQPFEVAITPGELRY